ncbi:hypothetical protein JCM10207_008850 [Rhodosporidiobolus poonsookiae]
MSTRKRALPTDFALANPARPPAAFRNSLASSLYSSGFPSQSAILAHHSCVNALAISPDGRWLASGGDDQRVLLSQCDDAGVNGVVGEPVGCYRGARSNIFAIDFSCDGKKILSAGNEGAVIMHDLETSSSTFPHSLSEGIPPENAWLDHDDSVMGVSCHPSNPHLFLTASSDGTIRNFDARTQPGCTGVLADTYSIDDVMHHPLTPDVFAYGGERAHVGLVDGRTAWSDGAAEAARGRVSGSMKLVSEVAVTEFNAALARRVKPRPPSDKLPETGKAHPTISSVAFSPSGSLLCATVSGHLSTLYELSSPAPLATFSAPAPPLPVPSREGEEASYGFPRGYRNTTTTKHGSFGGGPGATAGSGLYYAAGSDDFKAYAWEVPSVEALKAAVQEVSLSDLNGIGYMCMSPKPGYCTLPASISTPSSILTGNRSIVNSALFHPTLPLVFTSGVEKTIVRHSASCPSSILSSAVPPPRNPFPSVLPDPPPPPSWRFTPRPPRSHLSHPGLLGPADPALDPTAQAGESAAQRERRLRAEDREVLEYFDGLVEMEGEEALWDETGRGRFGGDSSEDEEEEEDDEMDEEEWQELLQGIGNDGTTRRMLTAIYAAEAEGGSSGQEEDESSDDADDL